MAWMGIYKTEVEGLPRWAAVALAVRCARIVQRYHTTWLEPVIESDNEEIEKAISLTERSAATARVVGGLLEACEAARRAHERSRKCFVAAGEPWHPGSNPALAASYAALAATRTAALETIGDAISLAFQVASGEERKLMQRDCAILQEAVRRERWTNRTPVSPRFFSADSAIERQVLLAIHGLCVNLCELIARDGKALQRIEWRLLEQTIAVALEGIGFEVECTPPSKDGGKDIVATCVLSGRRVIYYLEIKHWRSNKRVPLADVDQFVQVNLRDGTTGGLFLSTSDFAPTVYSQLSKINEERVELGNENTIISLCQHFVQDRGRAVWRASNILPRVLFQDAVKRRSKGRLL